MPPWLSLLSAGLKLLGLADAAERLIERWQARREGEERQRARDVTAENTVLRAELEAGVHAPSTVENAARRLREGEF